ncbi:MAG: spondin domain-containing protein [Sporichthyaceae bacterium]|nr:spondin domain-containing protein [Sporichthyaceae bacterium]
MRTITTIASLTAGVCAAGGLLATPAQADAPTRQYEVTITVRAAGQPLTPPLVAIHRGSVGVFDVGHPATVGVQQIAENGDLAPLHASLTGTAAVADVAAAAAPLVPAGVPGDGAFDQSVTLAVAGSPDARFLSWVSMLICTNDGFTGVDRLRLPARIGDTVSVDTAAYDAGTESNTEDFADIVPPCQGLIGISSGEPGTGTSNPALAEGGVITHHPGIVGGADLVPAVHGWDIAAPVAQITVERVS